VFKIYIRLSDEAEELNELRQISPELFEQEWNNIHGYIKIEFDGVHISGYYHEKDPVLDEVISREWVNWWLKLLLDAVYYLPKTKYVAFRQPEVWRWLEFTFIDENEVILKTPMDIGWLEIEALSKERRLRELGEKGEGNNEEQVVYLRNQKTFTTEKDVCFMDKPSPKHRFSYEEMKSEILKASDKFFKELIELNPRLLETEMAKDLLEKVDRIRG